MTLILTRSDVLGVISMREVIEAVEQAHADLSLGRAAQPSRPVTGTESSEALVIPMAATLGAQRIGGIKVFTDVPANGARGLPRQQSTIVLVDLERGTPEAFLDGGSVTLYRTAAASAVATRHLAREDSGTLGFVGAGALARAHLAAISLVRPIERVVAWSRTEATVAAFASDARGHGPQVETLDSARSVVEASDVLCTLTPSRTPVVEGDWFPDGLHVNAVGSPPRPDHREIDAEGMRRARIVVDSARTALEEAGNVVMALAAGAIAREDVADELGDVVVGARPGRASDAEITLYNSIGVAIQDVATARLVVQRARERGIGTEVELAEPLQRRFNDGLWD